jgi:hypothetical protein
MLDKIKWFLWRYILPKKLQKNDDGYYCPYCERILEREECKVWSWHNDRKWYSIVCKKCRANMEYGDAELGLWVKWD